MIERWVIGHGLGEKEAKAMTQNPRLLRLNLLAWGGIAARLDRQIVAGGRAFCFLPLPAYTGLPVHVNGYFELSANRRDIWIGDDMAGDGKLRSDWNRALLMDVVSETYSRVLENASEMAGNREEYYSLWPAKQVSDPWSIVVDQVYQRLYTSRVLFCEGDSCELVAPQDAMFVEPGSKAQSEGVLKDALLAEQMPIVSPPAFVASMFKSLVAPVQQLSASSVLRWLKKPGVAHAALNDRAQLYALLELCLSDKEATAELVGAPLLPMADGTVGVFGANDDERKVYLASEQELGLLQEHLGSMLELSLPAELMEQLCSEEVQQYTNVQRMDVDSLCKLVATTLPSGWEGQEEVSWDGEEGKSSEWVSQFWKYVLPRCSVELKILEEMPLLPTKQATLCRLSRGLLDVTGLPEEVISLLTVVGCRTLDNAIVQSHSFFERFVHAPNVGGVVVALDTSVSGDLVQLLDRFTQATHESRISLRQWLGTKLTEEARHQAQSSMSEQAFSFLNGVVDSLTTNETGDPLDKIRKILKSLPIYEVHSSVDIFVTIYPEHRLAPPDADLELLTKDFLKVTNPNDQALFEFLELRNLEMASFYKTHLFTELPKMATPARDKGMIGMLMELPRLSKEDPSFRESISDLAFVPNAGDGRLQQVHELYSASAELEGLLDDSCFPAAEYRAPDVAMVLAQLGIRTELDETGVLDCAQAVEALGKQTARELKDSRLAWKRELAQKRAKALLGYLDRHSDRLLGGTSTLGQELGSICWLPIHTDPPIEGLPWTDRGKALGRPDSTRPFADCWMCSWYLFWHKEITIVSGCCREHSCCRSSDSP